MDPNLIPLTALTATIVALAGAIAKLYYDNRDTWKARCELAEQREMQYREEVIPALKDNVSALEEMLNETGSSKKSLRDLASNQRQILKAVEGLRDGTNG